MSHEYRRDDEDALRPMIHRAVGRGDLETVARLIAEDATLLRCRNKIDNEPLHEACWAKHPAVALIERGADVNARGDFGQTPLHFAVRDGGDKALEIVTMLVDAGADVTARESRGQRNALEFAINEYKDELEPSMQLLREKGATG